MPLSRQRAVVGVRSRKGRDFLNGLRILGRDGGSALVRRSVARYGCRSEPIFKQSNDERKQVFPF